MDLQFMRDMFDAVGRKCCISKIQGRLNNSYDRDVFESEFRRVKDRPELRSLREITLGEYDSRTRITAPLNMSITVYPGYTLH